MNPNRIFHHYSPVKGAQTACKKDIANEPYISMVWDNQYSHLHQKGLIPIICPDCIKNIDKTKPSIIEQIFGNPTITTTIPSFNQCKL
jgi:hypothetical protein